MKNLYLFSAALFILSYTKAQLTVSASASDPVICLGNSTAISASATPLGYTMTSIPNNPQTLQGSNYLAYDGVDFTPLSTGLLSNGRWDNIALPFTFSFFGSNYNSINISTNGWVAMGSTNSTTSGYNFTLPAVNAPNSVIHALTGHLDFSGSPSGSIEYFENGVSPNRTFAVNFGNVKFFSGGGTADVQVILYETSNIIEIHTTDCTNTTLAKAQGIENGSGTLAYIVPGRNNSANWSATGMPNAYRFTPDNITYNWSPSAGLNTTTGPYVTASPTTSTTYTVNALNTVNSQTGSTTVNVSINPASFALAATAGGPQVCQNIFVSGGGTNYRDGNCNLIAAIVPSGASPVSNAINTCTKLDVNASKRGTADLYGPRKYDIEPLINPSTSTANVTLYYPQSDFDNFNARASDSGHKMLPVNPGDATGISNLIIRQFHGTGTAPGNYSGPGAAEDFSTSTPGFTVTWNATRNWWEITVPVTGFSGFYLTSKKVGTLFIGLDYFKGMQINRKNLLYWKVNCTSAEAKFEIQRSADALHFTTIGTLTASQLRCSEPLDYTDETPMAGSNYYRIKITDIDARAAYSNVILLSLKTANFELMSIDPNLVRNQDTRLKVLSSEKNEMYIVITDFSGRRISTNAITLQPGVNQTVLNTANLASGVYQVTGYLAGEKPQTLRLIKQ